MSQLTQFVYPYDPTGVNPTNKILAERHVVSVAGSDYRLIIPKIGPYFKDSLKIKHVQTGDFLVPGLDFTYSYYFEAASNTEPYPSVFGGISILTSAYDGATLELTEYQTLGGEFVLAEESIATLLANVLIDPRTTRWDDVTYKPGYWTPDSHLTHLEESVGYGELVQAVRDLVDNYNLKTQMLVQMFEAHMRDTNDPHGLYQVPRPASSGARIQSFSAAVPVDSTYQKSIESDAQSKLDLGELTRKVSDLYVLMATRKQVTKSGILPDASKVIILGGTEHSLPSLETSLHFAEIDILVTAGVGVIKGPEAILTTSNRDDVLRFEGTVRDSVTLAHGSRYLAVRLNDVTWELFKSN